MASCAQSASGTSASAGSEQLAKFDPLTGELNRAYLTEALGAALDEAVTFPRLMRFHAGGNRSSRRSSTKPTALTHRRRDRPGRQAHSRPHARQGSSRPVLRQQIRRRPDQLHARRIIDRGRASARGRARRAVHYRCRSCGCDDHNRRRNCAASCPHCDGSPRPRAGRLHAARVKRHGSLPAYGRMSSAMRCADKACALPTRSWPRLTNGASRSPMSR